MKRSKPKRHLAESSQQRAALTSPIRLEILGLFTTRDALSVADMAERMGRPVASLYYHVRLLHRAGLLKRVGERAGVRRSEALYRPIAERFEVPADRGAAEGDSSAMKTVASAFRMAERDFEAAISSGKVRQEGPLRNLFVSRAHCRVSREELRQLNRHLREIEKVLTASAHRVGEASPSDQFLSLTMALLPLRGRNSG